MMLVKTFTFLLLVNSIWCYDTQKPCKEYMYSYEADVDISKVNSSFDSFCNSLVLC